MMGGVFFFSYIMRSLQTIIKNMEQKMGFVDRKPELEAWIFKLQKYSDNKSLPKSLSVQIEYDFNYLQNNSKIQQVFGDKGMKKEI